MLTHNRDKDAHLVPALDDLTLADGELEGVVAVKARVELLAVGGQRALGGLSHVDLTSGIDCAYGVVDADGIAGLDGNSEKRYRPRNRERTSVLRAQFSGRNFTPILSLPSLASSSAKAKAARRPRRMRISTGVRDMWATGLQHLAAEEGHQRGAYA